MVHFVGAGSGAPDLITLRGARLLGEADVVIYAGSLVNPELLTLTKPDCEVHDSAKLTLEEVIALIERAEREGKTTVRLHTGDPSIYGAVREQFDELAKRGIAFDVCPGVSSFCGAAAALRTEYTLPDVSQTVIITRAAGRTPVPERSVLLQPEQLDLVLVPCTAFDAGCYRVGMGKGYYDRYLPRCTRAVKIGIALEVQRVPRAAVDDHDQRLDAFVTERGIYTWK